MLANSMLRGACRSTYSSPEESVRRERRVLSVGENPRARGLHPAVPIVTVAPRGTAGGSSSDVRGLAVDLLRNLLDSLSKPLLAFVQEVREPALAERGLCAARKEVRLQDVVQALGPELGFDLA